jgi:hypothetical protein
MKGGVYPGIEDAVRDFSIAGFWRIFRIEYLTAPLGVGHGESRFAAPDDAAPQFLTLYAASSIETAFREAVLREKMDMATERKIDDSEIEGRASVQIESKRSLRLLDLTAGAAQRLGVPTSILHATADAYRASRDFALHVHAHTDAEGIFYPSRFDDSRRCIAIFKSKGGGVKNGVDAMKPMADAFPLMHHPDLVDVLANLNVQRRPAAH